MLNLDKDGLIRRENGRYLFTWVNSHISRVISYPSGDGLLIRLYRQTEHPQGRTDPHSDVIADDQAVQIAVPPAAAERLANELLELVAAARGTGLPRQ